MRFSPTFLDDIRDRVPISDVIGRRVTWDRRKTNAGRGDYWGCCPFHGEKTPSFHCEDRKGRYHCFGCGVSGDHFRFLVEMEGMAFPEAVEQVATMAGVPMPAVDRQAEQRERERMGLVEVMELATRYFQERLQSPEGARARAYLRDRGLTARTIDTFRLGFSLDSRNALKEYLSGKGVAKEQMEACGLLVHGPDIPVSYDRFRDRIMFPILSLREKVIAFGGRAMAADAPAKYLNSNETELFHKGQVLFNHARARKALQGAEGASTVIAVEGYMDVIALHQAGIANVVAPLGTALTEQQLELMWKMTPEPVLCFDGDGAGLRAASRALDLALPHLKPGRSVRFALLPDGKDPDDLVRHEGRAPFDQVMAQARPLAQMLFTRETSGTNFDTPERRAELEARLRQITQVIADENVRRHYQQDIRDRLNAFFQPAQGGAARSGPYERRGARGRNGSGQAERGNDPRRGAASPSGHSPASERLTASGLVRGASERPSLRESVLALTIVHHPELLRDFYDDISIIDFDHRELQRFWPALLGAASRLGHRLTRESLIEALDAEGFAVLIATLEQNVRNARLWTATAEADPADAAWAYQQALGFHKRSKALRYQKIELQRDIAEATEEGDGERMSALLQALAEVQNEVTRLENQEAIIDGFGTRSGKTKGPVTTG